MASFTKAQFDLSGGGLTDVYICPAKKVVPVTLYLCNHGREGTFRISIGIAGAPDSTEQYIYYDSRLPANNTLKEAFTLSEDDVLRVQMTVADPGSCSVFVDEEKVKAP